MTGNNLQNKSMQIEGPKVVLGFIIVFFVCISVVLFALCSLLLFSVSSSKTEIRFPISTPFPLPTSLEEVKANCSKGECLNACLAHADQQLEPGKLNSYRYAGDEVFLVYYGISKDEMLEKPRNFNIPTDLVPYQQNETTHKIIWEYFKTLVPREERPNLVTFGIYIDSKTLGSFDTTLTENWITNINILSIENATTLSNVEIHEYGHYLTLNETQRDETHNYCEQEALYFCESANSYLNLFYLKFWEDIYPEWQKIDYQSSNYEKEIESFYLKYKDRFLNDYAATDPIEDIAESWTAFVISPSPTGDTVSEQKIKFFYNFPELVELRYQIIKGICTFESSN